MQQVIQYIRGISAAQFAGIVLLFFLPFVEVSCGNMFTVEISGQQFATGGEIDVPKVDNPALNITNAAPAPTAPNQPAQTRKDIDPKTSALLAWIAAAAGVVVSLIAGRNFRIVTAAIGGIGAVLMFWLKSDIDKDFQIQGSPQLQGILQLHYQFAFWASVILFLTAAGTNVYMLMHPPDAAPKP